MTATVRQVCAWTLYALATFIWVGIITGFLSPALVLLIIGALAGFGWLECGRHGWLVWP